MWQVVNTGKADAETNMRIDRELLEGLSGNPILHFYEWERPSATYGYFLNPGKYLNLEKAKKRGLELARRPTGGGIVFHIWDMAFSVLIPASFSAFSKNTLDNYAFVNEAVVRALDAFLPKRELELIPLDATALDSECGNFCMARPTKYDVVWEGRKIAGAAQRVRKQGLLHQGSIALLMPPEEELQELLLPGTRVMEAMLTYTYPLLSSPKGIEEAKKELQKCLTSALCN